MKDYYKRLGVSYKATQQEIKSAYRKLAIKYHPDKNNGDPASEAIFKEVNEAHRVLSNPANKSRYDYYFFYRPQPQPNYSRTYTPPPPRPGTYRRRPVAKKKPEPGLTTYLRWAFIIFLAFNGLNTIIRNTTPEFNTTPRFNNVTVVGDTSSPEIKKLLNSGNVSYGAYPTANDSGPQLTSSADSTANNWHDAEYSTGQGPSFYNFDSRYDYRMHNSLTISGSKMYDAVVNVMDSSTHKCIRCIYIRKGDSYSMEGIPPGTYYSLIALGSHWQQKNVNGKFVGRFTSNATYKMGGGFAFKKPQAVKHALNFQDNIILLDNNVYRSQTIKESDFNK